MRCTLIYAVPLWIGLRLELDCDIFLVCSLMNSFLHECVNIWVCALCIFAVWMVGGRVCVCFLLSGVFLSRREQAKRYKSSEFGSFQPIFFFELRPYNSQKCHFGLRSLSVPPKISTLCTRIFFSAAQTGFSGLPPSGDG